MGVLEHTILAASVIVVCLAVLWSPWARLKAAGEKKPEHVDAEVNDRADEWLGEYLDNPTGEGEMILWEAVGPDAVGFDKMGERS